MGIGARGHLLSGVLFHYRIIDRGTLSDGCWYVFFEKTVADMLCCTHRKDNHLVPCVGSFRGGNLQTCMARFKDFLRENFKVSLGDAQRVEGVVIKCGSRILAAAGYF